MKMIHRVGLAGVALLLAAPVAHAQMELDITPFVGSTFFLADPPERFALQTHSGEDLILEDASFKRSGTVGINAGLRFAERFAVEGMFSWLSVNMRARRGVRAADVNAYMYGLTGLFFIPVTETVSPFVGLGVGGETFDYDIFGTKTNHEWMGNAVAGLYLTLTDRFGLRFEARDCIARFESGVSGVDDAWENDLMVTMGFSFRAPLGR